MKKNDKVTYHAAKAELEKIVNDLKQGTADIDRMAENVKRATELLNICRERLEEVEAQVLPEFEEEN
ncbi:MAG: exodeoxyribonuclease VII small subunit [Prevotellaceae bacterium]|jgi:exodeoxyribonuclease VII small subunit|nr:exodeoxyribonuclease VII small subunit [Prevotellaceae bacterium]